MTLITNKCGVTFILFYAIMHMATAYAYELAVPAKFEAAGHFNEGVAPALSEGLWGLIDRNGIWILEPTYQKVKKGTEGMFAIHDGAAWGFMDTGGNVRIEPRYKDVRPFSSGYSAVLTDSRWRLIDRAGKRIGREAFISISDVSVTSFLGVKDANTPIYFYDTTKISEEGKFQSVGGLSIEPLNHESEEFFNQEDNYFISPLNPNIDKNLSFEKNDHFIIMRYGSEMLAAYSRSEKHFNYDVSSVSTKYRLGLLMDNQIYCRMSSGKYFIFDTSIVDKYDALWDFSENRLKDHLIYALLSCDPELSVAGPLNALRFSDKKLFSIDSDNFGIGFVRPNFASIDNGDFLDGAKNLYGVFEGFALYENRDGNFGFVEVKNDVVFDKTGAVFEDAYRYRESFAPVKLDGAWGYVSFGETEQIVVRSTATLQP